MNFTSTTRSERRLQEILKQRLRNLNQTGNQLTSLAVGDAAVAILCSTCNQQERNQKFAARTSLLLQLSKGQLVQVFVCCACVGTRRHSICQIKRFVQHQCFQVRTCHLSYIYMYTYVQCVGAEHNAKLDMLRSIAGFWS